MVETTSPTAPHSGEAQHLDKLTLKQLLEDAPIGSTVGLIGYKTQRGEEYDYTVRMDGHDTYKGAQEKQIRFLEELMDAPDIASVPVAAVMDEAVSLGAEVVTSVKTIARSMRDAIIASRDKYQSKLASGEATPPTGHPHVHLSTKGSLLIKNVVVVKRAARTLMATTPTTEPNVLATRIIDKHSPLTTEFCYQLALDPDVLVYVLLNDQIIHSKREP